MTVAEIKNEAGEIIQQCFFTTIEAALLYMAENKLSGTVRPLNQ